jgi:hypothetical protein
MISPISLKLYDNHKPQTTNPKSKILGTGNIFLVATGKKLLKYGINTSEIGDYRTMDEFMLDEPGIGEIVKRPLGEAPLDYIKSNLSEGLLLGKLAAQSIDLVKGHTYTYIPRQISMEETLKFKAGGKIAPIEDRYDSNGYRWENFTPLNTPIEMEFNRHLEASSEHVCVVEDIYTVPNNPNLMKYKDIVPERFIFHHNEAYIILLSQDAGNRDIIKPTIESVPNPFTLNFFLTSFPPNEHLHIQRYDTIPTALIHQFAAGIQKIITKAYDGESYIIWERA